MESENNLTDFERKLITIIQHNNKKGRLPSLEELKIRTGHNVDDIKEVVNNLAKRGWINISEGKLIVLIKLF